MMKFLSKLFIYGLLAACGVLLTVEQGDAQEFPSKPVKILVPFPPGGSVDLLVRVIGQRLAESPGWNQPIIVENKPGANTIIAADLVARSAPDGYTLLAAVDATLTMNPFVYQRLPYNVGDFAPVALMSEMSFLLVVNPALVKAKTLADLIGEAKRAPNKLNIGVGSVVGHVAAELFKLTADVDMVIIPFKGSPASLNGLLSGSVEAAIGDATYVPQIRSGKLKALAVTGAERVTALPDVPSISESGFKGFSVKPWFGLLAPRAVPQEIVAKINQEVNQALRDPRTRNRLADIGLQAVTATPEHFAEIIRADSEKWSTVIKKAGIRIE